MTAQSVARRYAAALMAASQAPLDDGLDRRLAELAQTLTSSEGRLLFFNPTISASAKRALVQKLVGESDILYRFLAVVIEHGREQLIEEVARAFHHLVLTQAGYTEAVVETARVLDTNEQELARMALDRFLGKKSWPTFQVEPALIGGIRVRFGDRMIDGTVAGDLSRLRNLLSQANQSEVSP